MREGGREGGSQGGSQGGREGGREGPQGKNECHRELHYSSNEFNCALQVFFLLDFQINHVYPNHFQTTSKCDALAALCDLQ